MSDIVFMDTALQRVCPQCGGEFMVPTPRHRKTFCSRSCAVKASIAERGVRECNNPNWRGGKTKHPLYDVYMDMLARCRRTNHHAFSRYGGRGIYVSARWIDSFWNFVEDMGERPIGHSIDRIDNDGPYSAENCRWATYRQQSANQRRRPLQDRDSISGRFVPSV